MSDKIDFNEMIQKQQLNLTRLQKRLDEMRREYQTYQQMINQLKNQIISKNSDEQKYKSLYFIFIQVRKPCRRYCVKSFSELCLCLLELLVSSFHHYDFSYAKELFYMFRFQRLYRTRH